MSDFIPPAWRLHEHSVNLLSTTRITLRHDPKTGRATLHPVPIVHERCPETMSTVHQQPVDPDGFEVASHKSPKVLGHDVTSTDGQPTLMSYATGDQLAREIAAAERQTPAGVAAAVLDSLVEAKWATTPWRKPAVTITAADSAAAEAILASWGL